MRNLFTQSPVRRLSDRSYRGLREALQRLERVQLAKRSRRRWALRYTEWTVKLVDMGALDIQSLLELVAAEQERTARQIASLEAVVAAIVEASELISTDDEHDPEGATIAYERAQAIALLRQARADSEALILTRRQLEHGQQVACATCGRDIDLERIAALPTTARCVRCAT